MKVHIQPTVVIISTRVDETVETYFDPDVGNRGSMSGDGEQSATCLYDPRIDKSIENQFKLPYVLESRPSPEFAYNAAIKKLVKVMSAVPSTFPTGFVTPGDDDDDFFENYPDGNEVGFTESRGTFLRLSAYIDTESCITVGCAGAALTYMRRRKTVGFLPGSMDGSPAFRVATVEMFNVGDMMYVIADPVRPIFNRLTSTTGS